MKEPWFPVDFYAFFQLLWETLKRLEENAKGFCLKHKFI